MRTCTQGITRMRQLSGRGIWEELKLNCVAQLGSCVQLLSRSAFDFVAVVAHFGLPISEQVAKIHRHLLFAVVICILFIAVAMAVTIQWTGLLDWTTGLTKTEMNRKYIEIRQCHTGKTWSFTDLASLTGLLRSAQYSVQSWCQCKCSSPCRKAVFGMGRSLGMRLFANCTKLEPVIQKQNPERKASVNYNW